MCHPVFGGGIGSCVFIGFKREFMIFFLFRTSGTRGKTKTANPSGRRFSVLRRRFYSASFLTTHRRELPSPIKGTLALHCQVARPVSESFLMLGRSLSSLRAGATKFCMIGKQRDPSVSRYKPSFRHFPRLSRPRLLTGCQIISLINVFISSLGTIIQSQSAVSRKACRIRR